MGRVVSHIALILSALALGGAHHPQPDPRAKENQATQIEHGSARIAQAISEIGAEHDKGCQNRQDDRSSDLCAQWKAADAAKNAATATWLAVALSFVGTLLIAMTFWETRKTSRAELRAYLWFKDFDLHVFPSEERSDHWRTRLECKIHNGGQTPAYDCLHMGNLVAFTEDEAVAHFTKSVPPPRLGKPIPYAVHNGSETNAAFNAHQEISPALAKEIEAEKRRLYAFGAVEYRDTFGISRKTRFCLILLNPLFPKRPSGKAVKEVAVTWDMAPFHNDAT
jgi:hypothetical protein